MMPFKRPPRFALPLHFSAVAFTPDAHSQPKPVELGDVTVNLVPPDGHCFLSESHKTDKRIISLLDRTLKRISILLALFADCEDLAD